MDKQVAKVYGNKVRVRACGLLFHEEKLLMVNHTGLTKGDFWAPPGGGVDFGTPIHETLKQEFLEETSLRVEPGEFLFGCEYIKDPLHSIELFFMINQAHGQLKTGSDPELDIIEAVRFMTLEEIASKPKDELHGIFKLVSAAKELKNLRGFFRI